MATAFTIARQENEEHASKTERRCLVTGEVRPKDDLIRFVVGPDQTIVPDFSQSLPGRGLWVTATREAIAEAAHKNLFARAAKEPVKADVDLADRIADLLQKRCLELLGLARSAGIMIPGQLQVDAAVKAGKVGLLLIATDAKGEIGRIEDIPVSRRFTRNQLGAALGHDQLVYVGFNKAHGLTEKLRRELARLDKIAGNAHIDTDRESDSGNS
jgi:predicted RNA-binding protein YlxR (DUF448 family)